MSSIPLPPRYVDLGPIGRGGMAEVRRVRDELLRCTVAMKICHADEPELRLRFFGEARLTAQLHHPGIVAVHDLGTLPDGRPFFTMEEVRGRTLTALIQAYHQPSPQLSDPRVSLPLGQPTFATALDEEPIPVWEPAPAPVWTLARLMEIHGRVARAVAYAHEREVVHRDLKPDNIMVDDHGAVRVMDWGLALWQGLAVEADPVEFPFELDLGPERHHDTRAGQVMGTPAFMAPEQARGARREIGPPADVYALGALLYTALAGHPPYAGTAVVAWRAVLAGPPAPLSREHVPEALCHIVEQAMSRDPDARHPSARVLADEIEAWIEAGRRRREALAAVARADALRPEILRERALAEDAARDAQTALIGVSPHDPVEKKLPGWRLEELAVAARLAARRLERERTRHLRAALEIEPTLPEAHAALADTYRADLEVAEARRDTALAEELEALLRAHDRGHHAAWLAGDGALTLHTSPPGARVELFRWVEVDRRLEPVYVRTLGTTPLQAVPVERGSHLLEIHADGRPVVRFPVLIGRGEHLDGVPPGADRTLPIVLPERIFGCDLPAACYVPAGWTWTGGDPQAIEALPAERWWVDGFVLAEHPVTNAEFANFLDALVHAGQEERALALAPTYPGTRDPVYPQDAQGRFVPGVDARGVTWRPDAPVLRVSWHAAVAYAAWKAENDGVAWRLPHELEWEKAARGVDRRLYPWGDFMEPTWANLAGSRSGPPSPGPVTGWPSDVSVYGVRGLVGNARDWCLNDHQRVAPLGPSRLDPLEPALSELRVVRGGGWSVPPRSARMAARFADRADARLGVTGFRLARSVG